MADLKDEASALYYTTKADAKIGITRSELNKFAATGATGKAGPELTKVLNEFNQYVAAWDAAKKDPAYSADLAQVINLAQAVSNRMDEYIIQAQVADTIDDAKSAAAKAKSDQEYSKLADGAAKRGSSGPKAATPAPGPAAPPAAAAPTEPPAGPKAPPPTTGETKALGGDNLLLLAAVGLGAAALMLGGKKRRG